MLRTELISTVEELRGSSFSTDPRAVHLFDDLSAILDEVERDFSGGSASNLLFLALTRTQPLTEKRLLEFAARSRIIPVLLNLEEFHQATGFVVKDAAEIDLKTFTEFLNIISLAFARPPHNVKRELCLSHLMKFLGVGTGEFRKVTNNM
jgi:hypothetical protein